MIFISKQPAISLSISAPPRALSSLKKEMKKLCQVSNNQTCRLMLCFIMWLANEKGEVGKGVVKESMILSCIRGKVGLFYGIKRLLSD